MYALPPFPACIDYPIRLIIPNDAEYFDRLNELNAVNRRVVLWQLKSFYDCVSNGFVCLSLMRAIMCRQFGSELLLFP